MLQQEGNKEGIQQSKGYTGKLNDIELEKCKGYLEIQKTTGINSHDR
ncbi:hypothetical protein PP175_10265 [Aneurinibacillus sp. Ricciae_BoGa-3]|nr:hypothetical protein [Aneurinibacillus sp. Ricciae_BoGa-3]WCK56262.1 hypothetical protein PP175_10265 [Aneurinibacillus sp. Ricciae_BoGa-3]